MLLLHNLESLCDTAVVVSIIQFWLSHSKSGLPAQNQIICLWRTQTQLFLQSDKWVWKASQPVQSLLASPRLICHSSCSHFKQTLIQFYMYDSWWVSSKAFRFIIKWIKKYLCESKVIQMFACISCHLHSPTQNLIESVGNISKMKTWWLNRVDSNQWQQITFVLWHNDILDISSYIYMYMYIHNNSLGLGVWGFCAVS